MALEAFFTLEFLKSILIIVKQLWFLWMPLILLFLFWELWLVYIRIRYLKELSWILLEIKIPKEIEKSPRAMEAVFSAIHTTRSGNLIERFWQGFLTPWFSFEITSFNGNIHFFVYTQKFFKKMIESQIYAHYPEVEITEVDDYTKNIPLDIPNENWQMWGAEFVLEKEDVYPIKTYMDFKLEDPKEEAEKIDPLNSFLEFLGSLKKGEQVWFQILIKGAGSKWKETGDRVVKKLLEKNKEKGKKSQEQAGAGMLFLSPGEQDVVKAIERNISKLGFETGIRFVYLARRDIFNFINVATGIGVMKQYNALHLNGFKPTNTTGVDYFFRERRGNRLKRFMIDAYRQRSYFYPPYKKKPFIFNTEELATIYHFPGRVAKTPTLERVGSRKGEPPPTLPVSNLLDSQA
jgi:hypothetical protein